MSTDSLIKDIKKNFNELQDNGSRKKTLDALASYGEKGIEEINNLISDPKLNIEVKEYGLELVKSIKKSSTGSL
jgi:hypothetical protein